MATITNNGMSGNILAKDIADACKNKGLFDLVDSEGQKVFDEESYNLALENMEIFCTLIIDHIKLNMVVKTNLDIGFGPVINSGIPVPYDGGSGLKTTQGAFISAQSANVNKATSIEIK